jgi:regulator of protease activity HflC (stomatin/prohibitin superfamily)
VEAAFAWIGDLVAWFAALIPRWDICRATHGGVKFVRGGKVRPIAPGIFWYWPAVTECVIVPAARQSFNIPPQSLTTKDGKTVLVSVVLVARIVDVVKALGQSWDVDDTVTEVGGAAAVGIVATRRWAELKSDLADGSINSEIEKRARRLLRPYGVQVIKGRFTDCAIHTVIRTIGSEAAVPVPAPEEE